MHANLKNLTIISFLLSGISFTLFPILRPFFDETSIVTASGFISYNWIIAHSFGMAGFIFLSLGTLGLYLLFLNTKIKSLLEWSLIFTLIGTFLTLPFFGAEAFSLRVIANLAIEQNSQAVLELINLVRLGPGIIFISIGLISIAIGSIILSRAIWLSKTLPKWSGIPIAIGLVMFMPILQGNPSFQIIRIFDALVILTSCLWIAFGLSKNKF